jgi:hypothetical protein
VDLQLPNKRELEVRRCRQQDVADGNLSKPTYAIPLLHTLMARNRKDELAHNPQRRGCVPPVGIT